ncbi:MAG: hypothetical protein H6937_12865 [Burkholderiales bacterium]|nr:hypothetical protein [Burkholderiales bacterium]
MSDQQDALQQKSLRAKPNNRRTTFNSIVIVVAIIMLWRGVWGLLDLYLFPGIPALSYLVSIALSLLVLYLNDFHLDNLKR